MNLDLNNRALILPLILVAVATSLFYAWGRKKNRWISGWLSAVTEDALHPKDTNYTNIGGIIGYHFIYGFSGGPWREAKGTWTLLPRSSLFFMPLAKLARQHDKYYLQLYTASRLYGEGHIIAPSYRDRAFRQISGLEQMTSEVVEAHGKKWTLLYSVSGMAEKLKTLLKKLENAEDVYHFCCYSDNKVFYLYAKPTREKLQALLESYLPALKPFFASQGGDDGQTNNKAD